MIFDLYPFVLIAALWAAIHQSLRLWQERRRSADMWICHQELAEALSATITNQQEVPPAARPKPKETTQDA